MKYNRTLQGLLKCILGLHKYSEYKHNANHSRKMCECCFKQYQRRTTKWCETDWVLIRTTKIFTDPRI